MILPARVATPRDKAKVETAVQIVEREILAPLRHERFTSLAALNHALACALERVNTRPFQKLAGTRRELFDALERAALRPLPPTRYELAAWRCAKVSIDYHISVERHLYSVPCPLVGQTVGVRPTATTVEILVRAGGPEYWPLADGFILNREYVTGAPIELVAPSIVHEATHGRLWKLGLRYHRSLRARIESVCVRSEIRFADRLPSAVMWMRHAEQKLEHPWWDDEQVSERKLHAMRLHGWPGWLLRAYSAVSRSHRRHK